MAVTPFARRSCTALVVIAAMGPWSAAQAEPGTNAVEMTCTGAAQATLTPGVDTTVKDFDITVEDSVLECDDTRQDADTRIVGARVSGTGPSQGHGNCGTFTATIEVRIDWITADGTEGLLSTARAAVDVDLTAQPAKVVVTREITDGLFAGYDIAAEPPTMALDAFAEACASPGGLKHLVGGHSISLSR